MDRARGSTHRPVRAGELQPGPQRPRPVLEPGHLRGRVDRDTEPAQPELPPAHRHPGQARLRASRRGECRDYRVCARSDRPVKQDAGPSTVASDGGERVQLRSAGRRRLTRLSSPLPARVEKINARAARRGFTDWLDPAGEKVVEQRRDSTTGLLSSGSTTGPRSRVSRRAAVRRRVRPGAVDVCCHTVRVNRRSHWPMRGYDCGPPAAHRPWRAAPDPGATVLHFTK